MVKRIKRLRIMRIKEDKRAQLKIQQMAFMLIGLVFFFSLIGLLILSVKFSSLKDSAEIIEEKNAKLLISKISNSPEFSCSQDVKAGEIDCIDSDKIMALKSQINKYTDFWGVSGIEIVKIYPPSEEIECNGENYPECNKMVLFGGGSGTGVSNFVSLCRKENLDEKSYDKCEIAKIIVTYESP